MSTLYIFSSPTIKSIEVLRALYFILSAGGKLSTANDIAIQPIFIGAHTCNIDNHINELEELRKIYENIRNSRLIREESRNNIFCTKIIKHDIIKDTRLNLISSYNNIISGDNTLFANGVMWWHDINNYLQQKNISNNDKVLFLIQPEDIEKIIAIKLLLDKTPLKEVQEVGVVLDEEPSVFRRQPRLQYALSQINKTFKLYCVPNTNCHKYFSSLLTASIVIDFSNRYPDSGIIKLPNGIKCAPQYYDVTDFPNTDICNCLGRFDLCVRLISGDYNNRLRKWMSTVTSYSNLGFMQDNDTIKGIKDFYGYWHTYMYNNNVRLINDKIINMDGVFKDLNGRPRLNSSLTNIELQQEIINSLIDAAYQANLLKDINNTSKYEEIRLKQDNTIYENDACKTIPNPFALFIGYKHAFSNNGSISTMRKQRSFCLDMWELLYRYGKEKIDEILSVNEVRIEDVKELYFNEGLDAYNEYNELFNDNLSTYFVIKSKVTDKIIAFSSTYTGFCICDSDTKEINIENHTYFSGDSKRWFELKDRDVEFRLFLKRYINVMSSFSQDFVHYINNSLSYEEMIQATTNTFFDTYDKYCKCVN